MEGLHYEVADERLHLTLGITADYDRYPEEVVARLTAIGEHIRASPATVVLDRLVASPTSIALRPGSRHASLHDLARALAAALRAEGLARPGWRFSPHVTLGYRRDDPFSRPAAPIGWQAADYLLIHSLVGEARHELLGRWPLARRQEELPL